MTGNNADTTIVFSLSPNGWGGVFSHFGEEETAAGESLDALMAQMDKWIETAPLGEVPTIKAFGAPVKLQERPVMRRRIVHEWMMELDRVAGAAQETDVPVAS